MMQHDWGEAKKVFKTIIQTDPEQILAHYQLGICERENGIAQNPINRILMWKNAKKHFLKVIEQDSAFNKVFTEYARLKRYQGNHAEAVKLGLQQLKLRPDLNKPKLDIFVLYDYFITHWGSSALNPFRRVDRRQINWLKARDTAYDKYFLGEKLRRVDYFSDADMIFRDLLQRDIPFSRIPIMLSRVRLLYQTDKPELAEKVYWDAVDAIEQPYEANFLYSGY